MFNGYLCRQYRECVEHGKRKRICRFLQLADAFQQGFMRGCLFHPLTHRFPVYYAPEGIDVVGAFVLIIQVVGMLPNVEAQQRGQSCAYGIASVRFFGDVQLAVLINRQPCPARTEQSDCCRVEFLLEILETAEVAFDGFRQFPGRFALRRFRCELQEVQRMCPALLNTAPSGAVATIVTRSLFSYSVPGTRLFRLFTYVCRCLP